MVGQKSKTKPKIEREGRYGRYKSRQAHRMISVKVPGGRTVIQFKKKKPSKAKCAGCGKVLSGVPRERPHKMKKMTKSKKKPERPYGGYLCSKCTRNVLRAKARGK
jgi:large subunit ribosomal protein L34e